METVKRSPFQSAFYIANTMEIFERLAWYGMYTLLASYIMTPITQGGLGMSNTERGLIMGIVPFFLYLFPVISGALADRFGYKKMFLLSFCLMSPSYFLLGYAKDLTSFISIFMLIALGAGIFKPVVTGTIARTTDNTNRGLGFGIFYMMVNIGGFLGPVLAPIIQKHYGWQWVFTFAAIWIAVNFIPALFFYKEPSQQAKQKNLTQVFQEVQQVLGNGRLALFIVPLLLLLIAFYADFISGNHTITLVIALIITAVIWDLLVDKPELNTEQMNIEQTSLIPPKPKPWYQQKMKIGNKPFMVYLLILTGFWTVYLQIFVTLPVYIRDYVDTGDMVAMLHDISPFLYGTFTTVNIDTLTSEITRLAATFSQPSASDITHIASTLRALDVRVPLNELTIAFQSMQEASLQGTNNTTALIQGYSEQWAQQYRQVNPATILSLDFLMIILFQVVISRFIHRFKPLPTLIVGTALISLAMLMGGFAHTFIFGGLLVASSVLIFAVGEMTASPKSQEYVASFAPADKAAMFMGYYFVSMALGNLFAGLLSGWLYSYFAIQLNQPALMWAIIACLGLITCIALYIFNKTLVADIEQQQLTLNTEEVTA